MTRILATLFAIVAAGPALAAEGVPYFSIRNGEFVVIIAFLIFVGFLVYIKVPGLLAKKLDERADGIKSELDEARKLREEAQELLASYERKQKEAQGQADRIVAHAKEEAAEAAEQARADLQKSIERRLKAAEEQIASAEARAVKDVRDRAISVATAAAREVIAKQMTATSANKLIDNAIGDVEAKLH